MKFLGIIPIAIGLLIIIVMLIMLPKNLAFANRESRDGTAGARLLMYWRIFIIQLLGLGAGAGMMYLGYTIIT